MKGGVFLIGMPGAGKSTTGKKLAEALNFEFFDLDTFIEQQEHKTINEIFSQKGEEYFRCLEQKALKNILDSAPAAFVCSTGGGTACHPGALELMKQRGVVIYLKAAIPVLLQRLKHKMDRPLIPADNAEDKLKNLLRQRRHFYEQADVTFQADKFTLEQLIKTIKDV